MRVVMTSWWFDISKSFSTGYTRHFSTAKHNTAEPQLSITDPFVTTQLNSGF